MDQHGTAFTRRGAHAHVERHCRTVEYKETPNTPLPRGLSLTVFTVSTFGCFGEAALGLLADLGKRVGRTLPPALLGWATWATPSVGPFARMAISFAVRRGLAQRVEEKWVRGDVPRGLVRPPTPERDDDVDGGAGSAANG